MTVDFADLRDASELLADTPRLRARLDDLGYLFLRGLLPVVDIQRARDDVARVLVSCSVIEDDGPELTWPGGPRCTSAEHQACIAQLIALDSVNALAEHPRLVELHARLLGEPVRVWNHRIVRFVAPCREAFNPEAMAHQDANVRYGFAAERFNISWIPLVALRSEHGGLGLIPRSCHAGVLDQVGGLDQLREVARARSLASELLTPRWARADVDPGDVIIMKERTVHTSLPNYARVLRLSCDFRYQAASATAGWVTRATTIELKQMLAAIDETLRSRALWVRTRMTTEMIEEIRWRLLSERDSSLARASALAKQVALTPPLVEDE